MSATTRRPRLAAVLGLRVYGNNIALNRSGWEQVLDDLRPDSELARRIKFMLESHAAGEWREEESS